MLRAGVLGPHAEAAERPRHAVPADRNAAEEFLAVLRVDLRAPFDRAADALLGRQRGQLVRGLPAGIGAEQDPRSARAVAVARGRRSARSAGRCW